MFRDAKIIHECSTEDAIASGDLVDAREGEFADVTSQHFAHAPDARVVLTRDLAAMIARAVDHPRWCNDTPGVWHDVLFMSRHATARAIREAMREGGATLQSFRVIITGAGRARTHTLFVGCAGDTVTYGLPRDF